MIRRPSTLRTSSGRNGSIIWCSLDIFSIQRSDFTGMGAILTEVSPFCTFQFEGRFLASPGGRISTMRRFLLLALLLAVPILGSAAAMQPGGSRNLELVGQLPLGPGFNADVWMNGNYAYVGTW